MKNELLKVCTLCGELKEIDGFPFVSSDGERGELCGDCWVTFGGIGNEKSRYSQLIFIQEDFQVDDSSGTVSLTIAYPLFNSYP